VTTELCIHLLILLSMRVIVPQCGAVDTVRVSLLCMANMWQLQLDGNARHLSSGPRDSDKEKDANLESREHTRITRKT
jgi:hypothetical protein